MIQSAAFKEAANWAEIEEVTGIFHFSFKLAHCALLLPLKRLNKASFCANFEIGISHNLTYINTRQTAS